MDSMIKTAMYIVSGVLSLLIMVIAYFIITHVSVDEERRKINMNFNKYQELAFERIDKVHVIEIVANKLADFLSAYGANYYFKKTINPYYYGMISIIIGVVPGILFGRQYGAITGILLGVLIAIIPSVLIVISNKNDNNDMLRDINSIYDALCVQTTAGMFLARAIKESSFGVKNKRLKTAMQEMNLNIEKSNMDLEEALIDFNSKFKNNYIDILVLVLKQSVKSGQASQYLKDLQEQMNSVKNSIEKIKEEKTNSKITVVEILIYLAIMIVIIVVLINQFSVNLGEAI